MQTELKRTYRATRPLEFVGFFAIKIDMPGGQEFIFLVLDAYCGFVYNLGREKNDDPETVLKKIYFLLEEPAFLENNTAGFTLVMEKYEDLAGSITNIVKLSNGEVMFNKPLNDFLFQPLFRSFCRYLEKKA